MSFASKVFTTKPIYQTYAAPYDAHPQDVTMALHNCPAGQLIAVPAATKFGLFTFLPQELKSHVFTFIPDWLIAETRGRSPYQRPNYTNIRQLLYECGVNPLLRTNKLVRSLTFTAWRLELLRWTGVRTQRDERRREKALYLIDLLGSSSLHLEGMRLLLTSNAKWERIKVQLHQITHSGNEEEHDGTHFQCSALPPRATFRHLSRSNPGSGGMFGLRKA